MSIKKLNYPADNTETQTGINERLGEAHTHSNLDILNDINQQSINNINSVPNKVDEISDDNLMYLPPFEYNPRQYARTFDITTNSYKWARVNSVIAKNFANSDGNLTFFDNPTVSTGMGEPSESAGVFIELSKTFKDRISTIENNISTLATNVDEEIKNINENKLSFTGDTIQNNLLAYNTDSKIAVSSVPLDDVLLKNNLSISLNDKSKQQPASSYLTNLLSDQITKISTGMGKSRGVVINAYTFVSSVYKVSVQSVGEGGQNYQVNDILTLPGIVDAIIKVLAIDDSGAVTKISISNEGLFTNAISGSQKVCGGSGSACTVNVTSVKVTNSNTSNPLLLKDIDDPVNGDTVYVIYDETHNNNKCLYQYDGTRWNFVLQVGVSEKSPGQLPVVEAIKDPNSSAYIATTDSLPSDLEVGQHFILIPRVNVGSTTKNMTINNTGPYEIVVYLGSTTAQTASLIGGYSGWLVKDVPVLVVFTGNNWVITMTSKGPNLVSLERSGSIRNPLESGGYISCIATTNPPVSSNNQSIATTKYVVDRIAQDRTKVRFTPNGEFQSGEVTQTLANYSQTSLIAGNNIDVYDNFSEDDYMYTISLSSSDSTQNIIAYIEEGHWNNTSVIRIFVNKNSETYPPLIENLQSPYQIELQLDKSYTTAELQSIFTLGSQIRMIPAKEVAILGKKQFKLSITNVTISDAPTINNSDIVLTPLLGDVYINSLGTGSDIDFPPALQIIADSGVSNYGDISYPRSYTPPVTSQDSTIATTAYVVDRIAASGAGGSEGSLSTFPILGTGSYKVNLYSGKWKIQCWGAQGGGAQGGLGGYAEATFSVTNNIQAYVVVGSQPLDNNGGFNGGGYSGFYSGNGGNCIGYGGGGCTHVALVEGELKELATRSDRVLIVAGGGGGCYNATDNSPSYGSGVYPPSFPRTKYAAGGVGGGTLGGDGVIVSSAGGGKGGTQTAGGATITSSEMNNGQYNPTAGSFGLGGNGNTTTAKGYSANNGGAGGGGWYGGGGASPTYSGHNGYHTWTCYAGGGGGSGYVLSKEINGISVVENSSKLMDGNSTEIVGGVTSPTMPNPDGEGPNVVGNSGHGCVILTYLGA